MASMVGSRGGEPRSPGKVTLAHENPLRLGPVIIEPALRRITHDDGREEIVEPRVMSVLVALLRAQGDILSRDDLIQFCWDGRVVGDDAINRVMFRLRRLVDGIGAGSFRIETVRKVGYRAIFEVPAVETPGVQNAKETGGRIGRRTLLGATAAALGVLAVLVLRSQSSETQAPVLTVAVGEFEPASADPESRRVARLAAEAVERTFARNFIETVGSRSSDPAALRKAGFGLSGTVDRQGNRLSVSANIVHSASGKTLWSTELVRSANEGRELTNELAIWVADVLRCSMYAKSRMRRYRSVGVETRILRWCEAERSRGAQFTQMPAIAQELVDAAPKSGHAYAYRAMALVLAEPERRDDIYAAARQALQLDPANGVARMALAAVPDTRVNLAERERIYREGMRLDPSFMYNRAQLSFLMRTVGRTEEATKLLGTLVNDYPLDFFQRGFWAFLLAQSGNLSRAREEFKLIAQLRPGFQLGDREALRAEILFGDPLKARLLANRLDLGGQERKCLDYVIEERADRLTPSQDATDANCEGSMLFSPALVHGMFGHIDDAYVHIERNFDSYREIPRFGPWFLYFPDLAGVRADRRFMPLMARLGYAQYWLETNKWPDFCNERLPYDCRTAAKAAVR